MRKKAKTIFEKDFWKLMNNAFYGKTMENIRNRNNVILTRNHIEAKRLMSKPNFQDYKNYDNNFFSILMTKPTIILDKPIYVGLAVLDYSKLLMYKFYYDKINKIWPNNQILYYDTDSYILKLETEDVYKDIKDNLMDDMDNSDYPKDHELYSKVNEKVIGKFKDELKSDVMTEVACLKAKAYAYKTLTKENKKLKGVTRVARNTLKFEEYKRVLEEYKKPVFKTMYTLNSEEHKMYLNQINKVALTAYDDKRYICADGIRTLPHCDEETRKKLRKIIRK